MALRTPPSWLQNGSHPAENDRLTTQAIYATTGTIGAASLAITAQGSPNMTVNAASGWCAILGSTSNSGAYVAYNDATTVLTITTADPSLPRIDRIVVTVSDSAYSGATNTVAFQVLAGTPNASPSAPATPSNSISLATIAVAAAASSISAGNITDTRTPITSTAFLPITGGTVTGTTTFSGATTVSGSAVFNGTLAVNGVTTVQNTITSISSITAATFVASAGTATVAPLKLTSGTNLTTPQAGAFEYDGAVVYFTPDTTGKRGVLPSEYWYLDGTASRSFSSVNTAQNLFGANLTVAAGTYEFEIGSTLSTGSTAHNTAFGFAGTATFSCYWSSIGLQGTVNKPDFSYSNTTAANSLFASTSTATTTIFVVRGRIVVSSGGTVIPQITFSAAPGGSNLSLAYLSYARYRKISSSTGSISIGAWA
jgi:hypothetical protein